MALNPSLDIATAEDELLSDTGASNDYLAKYHALIALQKYLLVHIATGQGELYSTAHKDSLSQILGVSISHVILYRLR